MKPQTTVEYLNNSVFATLKPSPIHGIGVFAIRDIKKGGLITDYSIHTINNCGFLKLSEDEMMELVPEVRELILDHSMFIADQRSFYFYSPNMEVCLQSFMNHSTDANSNGVFALRDIAAGEEVTEDYTKLFKEKAPHPMIKKHYQWLLGV